MDSARTAPLIKAALNGDQEAFSQLIGRHSQSMYAVAMTVTHSEQDALDAIQETVLALWLKLHTLQKPQYFKTWMTRILINNCCNQMRRHGKESAVEKLPEEPAEEADYDQVLDVDTAMRQLSRDDRLILQLFYFEDLSVKQIGAVLSLSQAAVKMRLSRSRQRFSDHYTANVQEVRYEK